LAQPAGFQDLPRVLWRERAFLLEQLREQYFERGRACSLQSGHAQIAVDVEAPVLAAGAAVAVFLGVAARVCVAGVSTLVVTTGLVTTRARGRGFARGLCTTGVTPSSGAGLSFNFGRLLGHSQHFSMDHGSGEAGRCRPQYQCSWSFQYVWFGRCRMEFPCTQISIQAV
jgi:hypothetical protein